MNYKYHHHDKFARVVRYPNLLTQQMSSKRQNYLKLRIFSARNYSGYEKFITNTKEPVEICPY